MDSTADLRPGLRERVDVVPLTLRFSEEEFIDGVSIDHRTFYEKLIESDVMPSTSQANPGAFAPLFEAVAAAGDSAVVITLSSRLSGTCQSARIAAGDYTVREAVPLQVLLEAENPEQYLRGVDTMFAQYPAVTLTAKQEIRCRNGMAFTANLEEGTYRVYGANGEFLALSHMVEGKLTTIKSFWAVSDNSCTVRK